MGDGIFTSKYFIDNLWKQHVLLVAKKSSLFLTAIDIKSGSEGLIRRLWLH